MDGAAALNAEIESVRAETERLLLKRGRMTPEEIHETLSSEEGKQRVIALAERRLQKRSMKLHRD